MIKKDTNDKHLNLLPDIAVCKKDFSGKVLTQNTDCKKLCGNRIGQLCTDNCMELYKKNNIRNSKGTFQFKNVKIDQNSYDILMINDGESILSLLYNLTEKRKEDTCFFKKFNLTPRELNIIDLVNQGANNQEIAKKLFISPKTLKTHINNILKKIPNEYWPR